MSSHGILWVKRQWISNPQPLIRSESISVDRYCKTRLDHDIALNKSQHIFVPALIGIGINFIIFLTPSIRITNSVILTFSPMLRLKSKTLRSYIHILNIKK